MVALILGDDAEVVQRRGDSGPIVQLPPYAEALLVRRDRPAVVALLSGQPGDRQQRIRAVAAARSGNRQRLLDPRPALGEESADLPIAGDGPGDRLSGRGVSGLDRPGERRPQILMLRAEPGDLLPLPPAVEPLPRLLRDRPERQRMAAAKVVGLIGGREMLQREVADGAQHREARLGVESIVRLDPERRVGAPDQTVVDQIGDAVEHVDRVRRVVGGDRLRKLQREAAGEDAEPPEQRPLPGSQQVVAPAHRVAQRLLPFREVAGAAGEQLQPIRQPREHGLGREQLGSRRRELDRQRQAVQPRAQLGQDRRVVRRQLQVGADRLRAFEEKRDRGVRGQLGQRRQPGRVGDRQRLDLVLPLAADMEHGSARHQRLHQGAGDQQRGEIGRRRRDLLEIVDDQQERAPPRLVADLARQRPRPPVADAQRVGDGRNHRGGIGDGGERDERDGTVELRREEGRDLEAQPRLARAPGAGQRHDPHVGAAQERADHVHLVAPADQRGQWRGRRSEYAMRTGSTGHRSLVRADDWSAPTRGDGAGSGLPEPGTRDPRIVPGHHGRPPASRQTSIETPRRADRRWRRIEMRNGRRCRSRTLATPRTATRRSPSPRRRV